MIARLWRGSVRTEDADVYADYIRETGFSAYGRMEGNRGAWMLRREIGELTEFQTYSLWDSIEAIQAFTGADHEVAVYYADDDRYLVERDDKVAHFQVADEIPPPSA